MEKNEEDLMVNHITLVGRVVFEPELRNLDSGESVSTLTLALKRPFKSNDTHTYESDFIRVTLWRGIAENAVQYCKKGSIIGIKGRVAQKTFHYEDEKTFSYPEIVAERLSFIQLDPKEKVPQDEIGAD
jgi:single-strand DNA-binding protein